MWRTVRTLATDTQAKITGELLPDLLHEVRAMSPRRSIEDTDDNHALPVEPATPLGALS